MAGTTFNKAKQQSRALVAVKLAHTTIWGFFAGCIVALPFAGWVGRFDWALMLIGLILVESAVLAMNRGVCPLTTIAARYTSDRSAAFDIYLPEWLAARNKVIFGTLFVVNVLIVLGLWHR